MFSKATIEIIRGLVYLSHSILLLTPIELSLKSFCVHKSGKLYNVFNTFVWPLILPLSLSLTVFDIYYFSTLAPQANLLILLYHGSLLISKLSALIAYVAFNTLGYEFCQLFNAIFYTSFRKQTHILYKRPLNNEQKDDKFFTLLIAC